MPEAHVLPAPPSLLRGRCAAVLVVLVTVLTTALHAGSLEDELGRNEVRVRSAPTPLPLGRTVEELALPERLKGLGYRRVHVRPSEPGEFFWGSETFWIFRRACRWQARDREAELFGLRLGRPSGLVLEVIDASERVASDPGRLAWLEPDTLAESLAGDRAQRRPVPLSELPDHAWRCVLAIEDARFLEHSGVDARSVARAALANLKPGGGLQGGSTLTQQLVKNRDLSPKRTLGRKVSEAVRALALEADHDKDEILQGYIDHVYLGNVDGLALHGLGAAAQAFFSTDARQLTLAQAATLAGVIQSPNRLSPQRHPEAARARRNVVLARMETLGWASSAAVAAARTAPLGVRPSAPAPPSARHFVAWAAEVAHAEAPRRLEDGRGVVVETTLDPWLQAEAERAVATGLAASRQGRRGESARALQASLVAVDAETGAVLAYVGGDPGQPEDQFDRVRKAQRQPGSALKPLVLLEAFEDCGAAGAISPSTRVLDAPVRLDVPGGPWEPGAPDGRYRGIVAVREALADSLNTPFVRIAMRCGLEDTAATLRRAGLELPEPAPPAFVLGAVEASPLELCRAVTVIGTPGRRLDPFPVVRIERPGGRGLARGGTESTAVVSPSTAYLVRDLLRTVVDDGTGRRARVEGHDVAGKTGTSQDGRDAWFIGHAEGLTCVTWMGRDDGLPAGLAGGRDAARIWHAFMARAIAARPPRRLAPPEDVVVRHVDPATGLLVSESNRRAREELYRRGALPRRDRFLRRDEPEPVIR